MWENYGFVIASRYRQKVIMSLRNTPKTPAQISSETGISLTHISRALREMTKEEIVECLTPERIKGRVYQLTEKGKKIVELLESK